MTVQVQDVIDFVSHDPKSDAVVLSMVEHRGWGAKGELLPDLQAKLNTYLAFVVDGQLEQKYPAMKGKKIRFRLHSQQPLGKRERQFIQTVQEQDLGPRGIEWQESLMTGDESTQPEH
jgi:hypothetical protein